MAHIIFITICDKGALGVRYLSSLLKKEGHTTSIVYFNEYNQTEKKQLDKIEKEDDQVWHEGISHEGEEILFAYTSSATKKEIELLCQLIKEQQPMLIGISMSQTYIPIGKRITQAIKKTFDIPVLWGGAGPTTEPEKCIKECDIVALGEAEYAVVELVKKIENKKEYSKISNLWVKKKDNIVRNKTNPLITELDSLPFPDFSFDNKFLISNDKLVKNCTDINNFPGVYTCMTARGCPYSCSFCINSYYRALYRGEKYVRRRSVANVMEELNIAIKTLHINYITFYDEVFTFDKPWIKEFCEEYKKNIGLPFWCNIYPTVVDEEIIQWLKSAGVESVTLGIQSGSEKLVKEIYTRIAPNAKILEAAQLLNKYKIRYYVDIITNSPFETEEDCQKTLDLLLTLPRPFSISTLSKLSMFNNLKVTEFYQQLKPKTLPIKTFEFYNKLYLFTTYRYLPKKIIKNLAKSKFFKENPQRLNAFFLAHNTYTISKDVIKSLLPQTVWIRIKRMVNA